MVQWVDRADLSAAQRSELERELAEIATLEGVVRWGLRQQPARDIVEVVTQDEYTHDVIVRWRGAIHLVFDAT